MNIVLSSIPYTVVAQTSYGDSAYGSQVYSCQTAADCEQTVAPPNTGFMGMSESAAIATSAGALLVAIALVGAVFVIVARIRRNKKSER